MMDDYDPSGWFWIVGGDMSRAWSSAIGAYVASYPEDRVTRIASESELSDVLRPYGLVLPSPTEADYSAAIQAHIDATAKSRGYGDGYALAGYASSTVPSWAKEARAFIAWRDSVWVYAFNLMDAVKSGSRRAPKMSAIIQELPTMEWPR